MTIAIRTKNLSRTFGKVQAVADLTLEVPSGLIFGFLGPNGAGKTTTIRLLLGLLEPTAGQAQVLDFDTIKQADSIRQRCGALLEHSGLYERLSAENNLEFYGRIWRIPPSERRARIEQLLKGIDLWDRRAEIVGKWSRGQKQKLAVARALLHRPQLIFMDEPTAGLDPIAAAALRTDLAGLAQREGVTIFLTTHNLPEAEQLCSQVGVIRQGRLLAVGTIEELRRRNGTPAVEIVGSGFTEAMLNQLRLRPEVAAASLSDGGLHLEMKAEAPTAPLVSLLVASGAAVEEVRRSRASLEQVFLGLMEEQPGEAEGSAS